MKRIRRLATVGAGALLLSMVTVPAAHAAPTVLAVESAADTYTSASAPTTDFGTSGSLAVYGSPDATTVLRFQVPAAPPGQTLTGAILRIRTTSLASAGSANTLNVRSAADSWSETGTLYANRPAVSGPTLGSLPGGTAANTAYDIPLDTSLMTGWTGSRTLALTGTGTDSSWFWSRQASATLRPTLTLTYTDGTPPDTTAPGAPGTLAATATGTTVALSWTAATDNTGVTGYTVHRSTTAGFTPATTSRIADTTGLSYTDTNRPAGTWYYRITATDAAGNTGPGSNEATATTQPPPDTTAPGAPGALAATATGTAVALSWTAATDNTGVTGYTVHRSTTAGFTPSTASRIADTTGLSFTDTNRPAGTWYYRVTATDAAGNTGPGSNEASATIQPPPDTTAPGAPGALAATATGTAVALSWTAATDNVGVTGYTVHRSTTAGFTPSTASRIADTTGLSYTDTNRPAGTWYYRVTATDAAGNTGPGSNEATATIQPPPDTTAPGAPGALAATATGTAVALSWTAATDNTAVTGYTVHRSTTAGFTPSTASRIADTTGLSYTDTNRPAGTWYYRVTATDAAGNTGPGSNEATATTQPAAPPTVLAVESAADTYTSASAPTTDFGTSGSLAVYGSPDATTVLRFQVPAAPPGQTLTGAILRIRTTSLASAGSANTLNVRSAADSWSETGTLYANRPAVSGPTLGSLPGGTAANTAYDIPLDTSLMTGWTGSRTLALTGTGTDSSWFWSRQASATLRPTLTLTYTDGTPSDTTAPGAPGALAATATGTAVALSWTAATDNTGVTGYTVHRSTTAGFTPATTSRIADTTGLSYTDTNRPAGTWYYRVTATDAAGNTGPGSNEATATTQPGAGGTATVLAVGDIACAPGSVVTSSACRQGDVAAVVAAQSPDRFIALGDLQYQNATLAEFMGAGAYNDTFGALKAITSPVLGNHEYLDNTRGYFDYFYGPGVTTGDFGPRTDGYYSTTIGAWTFIALNSECGPGGVSGGCGVGSPQYLWLQDRLTNSPTACTLVAAHHPRWSTGVNHGSYPELGPMWDLMAGHGVDVMISGHNHVSEIFKPIGASGSGTVPALSPTGIRSFTAGAGGADLQALSANTDPLLTAMVARGRSAFGPLKLTLNASSYSWQFLPLPGMTFTNVGTTGSFSGSDTCH